MKVKKILNDYTKRIIWNKAINNLKEEYKMILETAKREKEREEAIARKQNRWW